MKQVKVSTICWHTNTTLYGFMDELCIRWIDGSISTSSSNTYKQVYNNWIQLNNHKKLQK